MNNSTNNISTRRLVVGVVVGKTYSLAYFIEGVERVGKCNMTRQGSSSGEHGPIMFFRWERSEIINNKNLVDVCR